MRTPTPSRSLMGPVIGCPRQFPGPDLGIGGRPAVTTCWGRSGRNLRPVKRDGEHSPMPLQVTLALGPHVASPLGRPPGQPFRGSANRALQLKSWSACLTWRGKLKNWKFSSVSLARHPPPVPLPPIPPGTKTIRKGHAPSPPLLPDRPPRLQHRDTPRGPHHMLTPPENPTRLGHEGPRPRQRPHPGCPPSWIYPFRPPNAFKIGEQISELHLPPPLKFPIARHQTPPQIKVLPGPLLPNIPIAKYRPLRQGVKVPRTITAIPTAPRSARSRPQLQLVKGPR